MKCPICDAPTTTRRYLKFLADTGIYPYCSWICFADGEWSHYLETE